VKRRQFIGAGATVISSFGTFGLVGCGGGETSPTSSPKPTPTTPAFSFGYKPPTAQELSARLKTAPLYGAANVSLPSAVDLTRTGFLPAPGDQGYLNSCTAWAVGYGMCTYVTAQSLGVRADQLQNCASPADLYAKLLRRVAAPCNAGTPLTLAADILVSERIGSMAQIPYSDQSCTAPSANTTFGITGYTTTSPIDRTGIRSSLANGVPCAFGMPVYLDFAQYQSQVYRRQSTAYLGDHAMLLVGYDEARQAYRLMNSWKLWGEGGFGWIDYATFENDVREVLAPNYSAPSPAPAPSPTPTPSVFSIQATSDSFSRWNTSTNRSNLQLGFVVNQSFHVTAFSISGLGSFSVLSQPNPDIVAGAINYLVFQKPTSAESFPTGEYQLTVTGTLTNGAPVSASTTISVSNIGPAPTPAPTQVQLFSSGGWSFWNYAIGRGAIQVNFRLSEPILLQSYSLEPAGYLPLVSGFTSQWVLDSYLYAEMDVPGRYFAAGDYRLTLSGVNAAGQPVSASAWVFVSFAGTF
jgi:hypothetical protein